MPEQVGSLSQALAAVTHRPVMTEREGEWYSESTGKGQTGKAGWAWVLGRWL